MKKLLVIVDMQNDFVDGSLAASGGKEAVQCARALIEQERAQGTQIVFTRDLHGDNYLETQEGKRLPVPHCVAGTRGAQIYDGLFVAGAKVFEKGTFASTELARFVLDEHFDEVMFAGICTDICVISNALLVKAYCPEARVAVYASACAGTSKENHLAALQVMKSCQIDIL